MTWLTPVILVPLCIYYLVVNRQNGFFTAESLFVYCQALMIAGTAPLLDPARNADRAHGYILLYTFFAFVGTSTLIALLGRSQRATNGVMGRGHQRVVATLKPPFAAYALLALSIVIVILYFSSLGYSAFYLGVQNLLGKSNNDIATLRLGSYTGSRYLFPGYVNQFKNALVPALTLLVVAHLSKQHKMLAVRIALILIAIFGLIGTGQRGALVVFVVTVCVYLYWQDRRRFGQRFYKLLFVGIPVLVFATAALGRSKTSGDDVGGAVLAYVGELKGRLLASNQVSSVAGFRYVYGFPNQHGHEWAQSFMGLFPGNSGSDLSNHIFQVLYGGLRGTSPPSLWGSIYYNFGLVGIAVAPVIIAFLLAPISRYLRNGGPRNSMELVGVSGVATVFATWVAGSPTYLLNAGLVVYIFLWWWGSRLPGVEDEDNPAALRSREVNTIRARPK